MLAGHPHAAAYGIAAYAGVPLRVGGQVRGAVCCAGTESADTLNPRDEATLRAAAAYIGEVLDGGDDAPAGPGLRRLAQAVAGGHDLQALTRPLLQLLHEVTGLESTYLTLLDPVSDGLLLAYTHNTGGLHIPEGVTVAWQDSLCRRSIDEDRYYVADVAAVWPDAHVALGLGIATYASVPVRDAHDEIVGTLCGASSTGMVIDERDLAVMATFAQLLAAQLARETAHSVAATRATVLEQRLGALRDSAERDPLTGLANRAGDTPLAAGRGRAGRRRRRPAGGRIRRPEQVQGRERHLRPRHRRRGAAPGRRVAGAHGPRRRPARSPRRRRVHRRHDPAARRRRAGGGPSGYAGPRSRGSTPCTWSAASASSRASPAPRSASTTSWTTPTRRCTRSSTPPHRSRGPRQSCRYHRRSRQAIGQPEVKWHGTTSRAVKRSGFAGWTRRPG
nr:hypothetical protein GCM10020092_034660 [Actinoplanes digitatis]